MPIEEACQPLIEEGSRAEANEVEHHSPVGVGVAGAGTDALMVGRVNDEVGQPRV